MSDVHNHSVEILVDERITLETISLARLHDFHSYSSNAELYRFLEFSQFQTVDESRDYLNKLIDRTSTGQAQYWFIIKHQSNQMVGTIGFHSFDAHRLSAEIGFGIAPEFWRKGYFSAAARLVISVLEEDRNVVRIVARTAKQNIGSIRGLKKLGFEKEGDFKSYYRKDGLWMDAVYLARVNYEAMRRFGTSN